MFCIQATFQAVLDIANVTAPDAVVTFNYDENILSIIRTQEELSVLVAIDVGDGSPSLESLDPFELSFNDSHTFTVNGANSTSSSTQERCHESTSHDLGSVVHVA